MYPFGPYMDFEKLERDKMYLWEMYPQDSRKIKRIVEEALELEDYRGSFIYDEYPDKFLFYRLSSRIMKTYLGDEYEEEKDNRWLMEIIQVILANEIYTKRNRRKIYF